MKARFTLQPKSARRGDRWAHISCEYKKVPLPDGTTTTLLSKGVTFAPERNKLKRQSPASKQLRRIALDARRQSQRGER